MRTWENARNGDLLRGEAISLIFLDCRHLEDFFFHPTEARLRHNPEKILELSKSFSSGECLLIRVALDVWSGSGDSKLSEILDGLDFGNLCNVLNGLRFLADQFGDN